MNQSAEKPATAFEAVLGHTHTSDTVYVGQGQSWADVPVVVGVPGSKRRVGTAQVRVEAGEMRATVELTDAPDVFKTTIAQDFSLGPVRVQHSQQEGQ